jgi:hypothetical protein
MVLHLSALLVTQFTASEHDPRGVMSHLELGHYKNSYTINKILHVISNNVINSAAGNGHRCRLRTANVL